MATITNFGKQLRKLREGRKLSQQQLAAKIKCAPSAISRWENGDTMTKPSLQKLVVVFPELSHANAKLAGKTHSAAALAAAPVAPPAKRRRKGTPTPDASPANDFTSAMNSIVQLHESLNALRAKANAVISDAAKVVEQLNQQQARAATAMSRMSQLVEGVN